MTTEDYKVHLNITNWTSVIKKSNLSIIRNHLVLFRHMLIQVCCTIKVCGQFGKVGERCASAARIVQCILDNNMIFFPHSGGAKWSIATVAYLCVWVESACADFSGNDSLRAYQGDGDRQDEASDDP